MVNARSLCKLLQGAWRWQSSARGSRMASSSSVLGSLGRPAAFLMAITQAVDTFSAFLSSLAQAYVKRRSVAAVRRAARLATQGTPWPYTMVTSAMLEGTGLCGARSCTSRRPSLSTSPS